MDASRLGLPADLVRPGEPTQVEAGPPEQTVVDDRATVDLQEAEASISRVQLELCCRHPAKADPPHNLDRRVAQSWIVLGDLGNARDTEERRTLAQLAHGEASTRLAARVDVGAVGVDLAVGTGDEIEDLAGYRRVDEAGDAVPELGAVAGDEQLAPEP